MNNFWLNKIEEEKLEWDKDVEWNKKPREEWVMFIENIGHLYDVAPLVVSDPENDEVIFMIKLRSHESKAADKLYTWVQCHFEGAPSPRKVLLTQYNGIRAIKQLKFKEVNVVAANFGDLDYGSSELLEVEFTFSGEVDDGQ